MLYASPFVPMKSGISDYSEVLVSALIKEFEVTLLTEDYSISNDYLKQECAILNYKKDKVNFEQYDYRVYNIGNQPDFHGYIYEICMKWPGMIILHDFVLYYLFVGYYQKRNLLYSKTYLSEGLDSFLLLKQEVKKNGINLLEQKQIADILPLNKELIGSGNKIMVHSWYSYHKILSTGLIPKNNVTKINHIALLNKGSKILSKDELFDKYHIPKDAYILSSFGYISKTKLNYMVCKIIHKLNSLLGKKVCYVMVGEGSYVDSFVDHKIVFKTGYTELIEFNSFIEYSDVILNLRNPSMGETSGAMLRIMQKGKLCFINDGGWFSEIPEKCVCKVSLDNIENDLIDKISFMINNPEISKKIGENAQKYIENEFSPDIIVEKIKKFLKNDSTVQQNA